jgi:uncharacterized protein (DUF58 family)
MERAQSAIDRMRSVIFAKHPWPPIGAATEVDSLLDEGFLRQIERLKLPDLGAVTDGLAGIHQGRRTAQAIEFSDYRRYVPGDDLRLIDWRAYARLGELFVKTSRAQESVTLTLLMDCSGSMDSGDPNKLLYAKSLAAALGAVALLRHDGVRLFAFAGGPMAVSPLLRGRRALHDLLAYLHGLSGMGTTDLLSAVLEHRHTSAQQGIVILLSDLLVPAEQQEALAALGGDGTIATVLHIVDPGDAAPGVRGAAELRDRESGETITVTITPALLQRYAEQLEARSQALAAYCLTHGVRYVRVATSVPPTELVLAALADGSDGEVR